jgi:hypothetical protein
MSFKENGFEIVKQCIPIEVCKVISRSMIMAKDITLFMNNLKEKDFPCKDDMVNNCFSRYAPLSLESLSDTLIKDVVERIIGEKVFPTYTHGRLYYEGATMYKHIDRESSEIAASLCLDVDKNFEWPLMMEDKNKKVFSVYQNPGDIIIYEGNNLSHWRDVYEGNLQINGFFFFCKESGIKKILKYDTRPMLGLGAEYRKIQPDEQLKIFES